MTRGDAGARERGQLRARGGALLAAASVLATVMAGLTACADHRPAPRFVATIAPLGEIVRELAGDRATVAVLLPPGASPHTFEPRPSDVAAAQGSAALFVVSPSLDGWAARLPAPRRIDVLPIVPAPLLLPATEGGIPARGGTAADADPHFWTDPTIVRAVLPALADSLCAVDAPRCATYRANAARYADTLRALDAELAATLAPLRGRAVVLFHPSFRYLLRRYGIVLAALVEPSPGKEPTARSIERAAAAAVRSHAVAIFTEPQLPRRPAEVVAELAHVPLAELDPLGGVPGRDTYARLLRHDAAVLRRTVR